MTGVSVARTLVIGAMLLLGVAPTSRSQGADSARRAPATIGGVVVDAHTGAPVPDAVIGIGAGEVRSDERGRFRLPARGAIEVRRLGYEPRRLVADGDSLIVRLAAAPRSLESVVVTAGRREQKLKDAIVSTEVISRRDLEQSGASDLSAALAGQTGLPSDAGLPAGSGVLLQGLGAQRVLVLIDGQPVTGRVAGHLDLSRFPVGMIERVEVVKGPQSTLYGSDAMGGVINLITRRPETPGLEGGASFTAGTHGRRDGAVTSLGRFGDVGIAVDAGLREVDLVPGRGDPAATFANRWDVAPRVSWRLGAATTLDAAAFLIDERQRYRIGQLYQHSDNVQSGVRAGASRRFASPGAHLSATVHHSRFEHLARRSTTGEPVAGSGERDVQSLVKGEVIGARFIGVMLMDGGLEVRRERIEADRVAGGRRTLEAVEPFAQGSWTLGGLSLVTGARMTWSEQWGTAITPRLAALWRPSWNPSLGLRGSLSRGFRAPDFKELYLEFVNPAAGYAVRGNPALSPERSANATGGVEWTTERFGARATAYHNRFTGFIEAIETETPGEYTYRNLESGTTSGVDADASASAGSLRIDAGYAWLRARDDSGNPLVGRPLHSARLSAAFAGRRGTRMSLSTTATGAAPAARDASGRVSRWRGRHVRLDARVAQQIRTGLDFAVGVENVFDQRMGADWPGFTGRLLTATLMLRGRHE